MECAVCVADGHDGISSLSHRLSVAHGPPQSGCVTIAAQWRPLSCDRSARVHSACSCPCSVWSAARKACWLTTTSAGPPPSAVSSMPPSPSPPTIPSPASRRPKTRRPTRWASTTARRTSASISRCGSTPRGWGSNIDFPSTGQGIEVDVAAGFKARAFNRKLSLDLGYIRYTFLGPPADLAYNYGDINLNVGYDFGFASLAGARALQSQLVRQLRATRGTSARC